jgi:hypothetical protein
VYHLIELQLRRLTAYPLCWELFQAAGYDFNQQTEIARFLSTTHIIWAKKSQVIL